MDNVLERKARERMGKRKEKREQRLFTIYICRPTGRFMVWVNGKQNLERKNFAPESRLSFAQITHLPKNGRETLNRVSKMAFKKWNTNFRLKHFILKKGLPFQKFRCSRTFSTGSTRNVVFL